MSIKTKMVMSEPLVYQWIMLDNEIDAIISAKTERKNS